MLNLRSNHIYGTSFDLWSHRIKLFRRHRMHPHRIKSEPCHNLESRSAKMTVVDLARHREVTCMEEQEVSIGSSCLFDCCGGTRMAAKRTKKGDNGEGEHPK